MTPRSRRASRRGVSSLRRRPAARLESLEQRWLLAITDVTSGHSFGTIEAAIDAASTNPGDTILVDAGTYTENVNVDKPVVLEGAQHGVDARTRTGAETIMTGSGGGNAPFDITANKVTIDGFTIEGASTALNDGIVDGVSTSGAQIVNNIVQNYVVGLALTNSTATSPGLVQHNLFDDSTQSGGSGGMAIYSDQSVAGGTLNSVVIDSNTFSGNTGAGIDLASTDATKPATAVTISNNLFNANAAGLTASNLTSSTMTGNTFSHSTSGTAADLGLLEGDSGLTITHNLLENGAGWAVRISNNGSGAPAASNITFNYNSISGYTGANGAFEVDRYSGTLDASRNWWGDLSGPTIASNAGGVGQTIVDPSGQVSYRPWLIYGTNAAVGIPGFQLPATVPVSSHGDKSAAVNDFTLLQNAVGSVASGQKVDLSGAFDFTAPNAAAAYAASVATSATPTIRGVVIPDGVNDVTITSSAQNATITGGGDSTDGIYNAFLFTADGPSAVGDSVLTISQLNIVNFKSGVTMGLNSTGIFDGTVIENNSITVAADNDNNANDRPGIAIYLWRGQNEAVAANNIYFQANGTRTATSTNWGTGASSFGLLEGTHGGTAYSGLAIEHNNFQLLPTAVGGSEVVTGIWENTHNNSNASSITISDNQFLGIAGQRLFDRGLMLTSQTANLSIDSNTFTDVQYVYFASKMTGGQPGDQFTFTNNTLTRVGDASGVFLQNVSDNPTPVHVLINWGTNNFIDRQTGIRGLNELSTQATARSRPAGGATDLNSVVAFGPMPADFVSASWGTPGRFTNPLASPDGMPGPIAYGFNTFTTVQAGVNAVDLTGTTNLASGTYAENVSINKDVRLAGLSTAAPTAIIAPVTGDGITVSAPAINVKIKNLAVTGAVNGINASGISSLNVNNVSLSSNTTGLVASNLTTLTLINLTLSGNSTTGGSVSNVSTIDDTPITGSSGVTTTITGSSIQRGTDDVLRFSGVTSLNVTGSDGGDTYDITPSATTTISVDGGLPTAPASPGDTLNVPLTGLNNPSLTESSTANGLAGSWTFGNAMPVNFQAIETLSNVGDLAVTETDNSSTPGSAVPGASLIYTVVVSNSGTGSVTGATVNDVLPGGFTNASFTATATGGATGFSSSGSGGIHDTVNLPAGSSIAYRVSGTIRSSASGVLSNTASVAAPNTFYDPDPANNSFTDSSTLTPQADLSIGVTDNSPSPGQAIAGASLTYSIVVRNVGPSDVAEATVADTLPAGFAESGFTARATGGATGFTASGSGKIGDTVNLPAGSTITYIVTGTVNSGATGTLANSAVVNAPASVSDTNLANNTSSDTLTVSRPTDLSVTNVDNSPTPGKAVPGAGLTYTIVVANSGANDAAGATVSDLFPAGFTGVAYTASATGGATGFTANGHGNISDTVDLPAGSTITYVAVGTISASASGMLLNTARVTPPADLVDTNLANNIAPDSDTLTPQADLSVVAKDNKGGNSATSVSGSVVAGTSLTYTLIIGNPGPSDVTAANIADMLPTGFAGATFTASASGGATGFTTSGTGNVSDTVNLPAGSSITYVVSGTVASSVTGNLSNSANVTLPAGVTNTGDTSATDVDAVTRQVGVSVVAKDSKGGDSATSASGSVVAGTALMYTVIISNNGPSDITGATIADVLPTGLAGAAFTAMGSGGASGFTASGIGNINDTVNLPAGSSITYLVTGTVASSATGNLSNTVNVTLPVGESNTGQAGATDADAIMTPHESYVTAVYADVLERAPDARGLAYWVNLLDQGTAISSVAEAIAHSAEYYANFVIKPDYLKLLGRAADADGLQYWTAQMESGLTDQQLEAGFIAADEFYNNAGGTDVDWIDAVYQLLLGRAADSSGEMYWTGQLAQGQTRLQVAELIAGSTENNTQLINADYFHYLGRAADPAGLSFWLQQFVAGETNEDVIAGFTGSAEYYQEHTS